MRRRKRSACGSEVENSFRACRQHFHAFAWKHAQKHLWRNRLGNNTKFILRLYFRCFLATTELANSCIRAHITAVRRAQGWARTSTTARHRAGTRHISFPNAKFPRSERGRLRSPSRSRSAHWSRQHAVEVELTSPALCSGTGDGQVRKITWRPCEVRGRHC